MINALNSGSKGPGPSPGRGRCVVLGKTLYLTENASIHPGI